MKRYGPDVTPNPKAWLALDEDLRVLLVEDYHRAAGTELPSPQIHAAMHVVIENQIAAGRVLDRSRRYGAASACGGRAQLAALPGRLRQSLVPNA